MTPTSAIDRWRQLLEARAIPQPILDAAPVSPWGFPTALFRQRAERARSRRTPTVDRAREALPAGGTVLDVGCGGGATSIGLAGDASTITGIDTSPEMLTAFREAIAEAGGDARTVEGGWPDVAPRVETGDVVVCGHVLYNVQPLQPFVDALTDHARARVVVEITDRHPLVWMNDLWARFHGVRFPDGPSADDAMEALREMGLDVRREDRVDDVWRKATFETPEDAVALTRTRLCLKPDRDEELVEALGDRLRQHGGGWSAGPPEQPLATLWWSGRAG